MTADFAPKGEEVLQAEVLEDLGLEAYEGNEEIVDRVVARRKKDEDFKASLHEDKTKAREKLKEARKLAGLDPETGEKLQTNVVEPKSASSVGLTPKDVIAIRDLHEADLEFLMEEAKLRNQSIAEVKANPYIQNTLRVMAEERKSAQVTQVKPTGRNNSKSHDEKILEDFANGIVPENPEDLAKAQYNERLRQIKN